MVKLIGNLGSRIARLLAVFASCATVAILTMPLAIADITVTVQDADGAPVNGFRYLVEEDPTVHIVPPDPGGVDTSPVLAFQFHASHAPVVASGESADGANSVIIPSADLDSGVPYVITVNPFADHSLSTGYASDDESITVTVNAFPMPTAQISILVFRDDILNGAPDLPMEIPGTLTNSFDPTNFSVIVEEAGGKYGASGGPILLEAFGNPLGTTYLDTFTDGQPDVDNLGDGILTPAPNGVLVVKNLVPGKYGIVVVPPQDQGWMQTSTIEGSKVVDAWVTSDEPPYFVEFGPPGHHVFVGFTQEKHPTSGAAGSISGTITNMHMSRPPNYAFDSGNAFPDCRVGLLPTPAGGDPGPATHVQSCDDESGFSITDIEAGLYTLVVFDVQLNVLIAKMSVAVGTGGESMNRELGSVPVFNWFGRFDSSIFYDANQNGIRDPGEDPIHADKSAVNLRFRDGTIYQSFPVDTEGFAPFDTVFPFFHWLVPEVDFVNLKATGATYWVDDGGLLDETSAGGDVFTPQPQDGLPACEGAAPYDLESCTYDGGDSRTLRGPVLTLGMQTFLGMTNKIEFGKAAYVGEENGGISGLVFYAVTRAENDPRLAAAEEWEPGIPRVQVNLYQSDGTRYGKNASCGGADDYRADLDEDGCITEPDIDAYPLGDFPGPGDTDHNSNTDFDYGDAVQVTWTDSWDDSQPTNCQGSNSFDGVPANFPDPTATEAEANSACFDGIRNLNQIREAVFDGGYAFDSYLDRHPVSGALLGTTVDGLPTNIYIVEAVTPTGYTLLKEEDRNVDFGDSLVPSMQAKTGGNDLAIREKLGDLPITIDDDLDLSAPAACVGPEHLVQDEFSYLTHADGTRYPGVESYVTNPDNEAPYRGEMRRLCDQKVVTLFPGKNTAADFFVFTQAPISSNVVGTILNDLGNEFDLNSPNFGEKHAPSYLPIGFYDWAGNKILHSHSDKYGKYNVRLPSTVTINSPMPSGVSPYMATACMNDAGKIDDGFGNLVRDPHFDPRYTQFCYTLQYMPGSTSYLDTPVLPISAFATTQDFPLDCEIPNSIPVIYSVDVDGSGPVLNRRNGGTITIASAGFRTVRNPAYVDGTTDQFIDRDNGFGAAGSVTLTRSGSDTVFTGADVSWGDDVITFDIPGAAGNAGNVGVLPQGEYQLTVTNAGGMTTTVGVTFTILGNSVYNNTLITVGPSGDYSTIQAAIDAAESRDLITVAPGEYDELVILYKSVKLQGWGAESTLINASKFPARKLNDWRDKIDALFAAGQFTPLPHQEDGFNQSGNEPDGFFKEEGAGITVVAALTNAGGNIWRGNHLPRIDGLGISGASHGGGVFINGYVKRLMVSNNHIFGNHGTFGGGIRAGDSFGLPERDGGFDVPERDGEFNGQGADNDDLNIHHNQINQNGTNGGSGAGIALYTGADDYLVSKNWICGNFSQGNGGGIGHKGLSNDGVIEYNLISFNQSFKEGSSVSGGGISIAGIQLLDGEGQPLLTEGSGSVIVKFNVIVGNQAGAGNGGGIHTQFVDGTNLGNENEIKIKNSIIANNVAGLTGAGISLSDTIGANIFENTIANNDSTATAGPAFTPGDPNESTRQVGAGIASFAHSPTLAAEIGAGFSDPRLRVNIIWRNRVFNWVTDVIGGEECFHLVPYVGTVVPDLPGCAGITTGEAADYSDLAVIGIAGQLDPRRSILTDTTGYHSSNTSVFSGFDDDVPNGEAGQGINQVELTTGIAVQPALDEGGNFIDVRYGPITMSASGNYNETAVNGFGQQVGATNLGADGSRWVLGYKVAGAGSPGTSSGGATDLSLSGVSSSGATGYGLRPGEADDEESDEEASAEDGVKSITMDLGGISMDATDGNATNEESQ